MQEQILLPPEVEAAPQDEEEGNEQLYLNVDVFLLDVKTGAILASYGTKGTVQASKL